MRSCSSFIGTHQCIDCLRIVEALNFTYHFSRVEFSQLHFALAAYCNITGTYLGEGEPREPWLPTLSEQVESLETVQFNRPHHHHHQFICHKSKHSLSVASL